ncbi:alpha-ketoglutarate-dependent dioxygenase AlkB [Brevundimonas sp. TWP2-3-4b2]|uniref:alpha-ketoglutarate-dependent dioxygenase AlkB n=1 Tax=Brevundimonas sp. TWP2-3-4b2 TaxID=2804595 RepID=UPI003CEA74D9
MSARAEIDTGMEGFRFWPGALSMSEQADLLAEVLAAEAAAPFYQPMTPGGRPFSVRMTGLGPLGWVSDRSGYRYQSTHPVTGSNWPPIPGLLLALWRDLTGADQPPDACLVNLYREGAKMGLHQDRDEADLTAPVLSVSLGDAAVFRIGAAGGGPTRSLKLSSGDVCALTGPARLARHGIDRVIAGSSSLVPGGGRINLTLRVAAPASQQS